MRGALVPSEFGLFPFKAVFDRDSTSQLSAANKDSFNLSKTWAIWLPGSLSEHSLYFPLRSTHRGVPKRSLIFCLSAAMLFSVIIPLDCEN